MSVYGNTEEMAGSLRMRVDVITEKNSIRRQKMQQSIKELRLNFEAETDLEIKPHFKQWRKYALWLENLQIQKLNREIISENKKLRRAFYKVVDILEISLSSPT